jgi:hypothetical protein
MRGVLVGLLGAVLAVGAAGATENVCKLDGLELTATRGGNWENDPERPDLIGKPFKITRVSSLLNRPSHGSPGAYPKRTNPTHSTAQLANH